MGVVDFRVVLPRNLSPVEVQSPPPEYTEQYTAVFGSAMQVVLSRTLDELIDDMDRNGVEFAVMHAEYSNGDPADAMTAAVAKVVRGHPDRFAGFGAISLQALQPMKAVRQAVHIAELGLAGVNVNQSFMGVAIDDRRLYPFYSKASELSLIVALHTGVNYTTHHPIQNDHPMQLDQVACDFPDLTLVACHAGWPWIPEMVAVARKHPRVFVEFGGIAPKYVGLPGTGWEVMHRFMNSLLSGQILFGTDWPLMPYERVLAEWRAMDLKPAVLEALLSGNANRLLGRR